MNTFLDIQKNIFTQNEDVIIPVYLDAKNDSINAIEGNLSFPHDVLVLKEVRDGNSSINFWIEKPQVQNNGTIVFSGITPGGLSGSKELLFTAVFHVQANTHDSGIVTHIHAFRNDGNGTPVIVPDTNFHFSVGAQTNNEPSKIPQDTIPPENFNPLIGKDPNIFNGHYFVAFSTQDKGVGMGYYQVREGLFGSYKNATSPFVLENQKLNKKIFIKAVDQSGNVRIATVVGDNYHGGYLIFIIFAILLGVISVLLFKYKKVWRKFIK